VAVRGESFAGRFAIVARQRDYTSTFLVSGSMTAMEPKPLVPV
jgi:hypothetical protein